MPCDHNLTCQDSSQLLLFPDLYPDVDNAPHTPISPLITDALVSVESTQAGAFAVDVVGFWEAQSAFAKRDYELRSRARETERAKYLPEVFDLETVPDSPLRGTLYPNGEFTLGFIPQQKKKVMEKRFDNNEVLGHQYCKVPKAVACDTGEVYFDSWHDEYHLKLDSGGELARKPKNYGGHGITKFGKRQVRNGCFILQEKCGKGFPQFGTLTLPSLTPDEELVVCKNWGEVTKTFFQKMKRQAERFGEDFDYVSVVEVQPRRWEESRFVGLHLHFVFRTVWLREEKQWLFPDFFMRDAWRSVLVNVIKKYLAVPSPDSNLEVIQYRREPIKGDVAGYVSKYMSKGGDMLAEIVVEKGIEYLPRQWWSMSKGLRAEIRERTVALDSEVCHEIADAVKEGSPVVESSKYVYVTIDEDVDVCVGLCGRLNSDYADIIRENAHMGRSF